MKKLNFRFTKRGIIALSLLLLLLAGAIWLNVHLDKNGENSTDLSGNGADALESLRPTDADVYSGYFEDFRNERNTVRAREIEYLRMIIAEDTTDAETLQDAQARLMELVNNMEQEFSIESQIRAKGFLDAAVTFRNGSISVIVDGDALSDEEVARILEIVSRETGVKAVDIKISLSKS
ncbi:MAG: SpoIIIAH-like family protein [Christensenellaceae bacterium]|nr:SpoIIIAH-like family protein [Christensenellaceae bacterium]